MRHTGPIAGVATHEHFIATAGYDNRLILWDIRTRAAIARSTHDHLINSCDFSHDGRWLVSASSDYSARIWSVPDLRLQAVLLGHNDDVDMARFSPDDRLIATCALDRMVRIFDRSGRCLHELAGHSGNVLALAWADVSRVISTSVDGTLREWDAVQGRLLRTISLGMRADCVEIDPAGRNIAGDDHGRIALVSNGVEPLFIAAHTAGIKKLVLSADGGRMVTLAYDRTIAVWELPAEGVPLLIARGEMPPLIWARTAAICADGRIAVGTFGGAFALFDPDTATWDLAGVSAGAAINAVLDNNGVPFTVGDAGTVRANGAADAEMGSLCNFLVRSGAALYAGGHLGELYDGRSGRVLYRHHSPLNCAIAFQRGPDDCLAVGTYTGDILIFSHAGTDSPELLTTLKPYDHAVKSLACADGILFSVCASTDIAWHAIADWSPLRTVARAHTRIANAACALGKDGFASIGRDRVLRLWLENGDLAFESPHPNSVKCMASTGDGSLILTGSYGGTIAMFDLAIMQWRPIQRISKAGISAICWSEQAQQFFVASYDGEIHRVTAKQSAMLRLAA